MAAFRTTPVPRWQATIRSAPNHSVPGRGRVERPGGSDAHDQHLRPHGFARRRSRPRQHAGRADGRARPDGVRARPPGRRHAADGERASRPARRGGTARGRAPGTPSLPPPRLRHRRPYAGGNHGGLVRADPRSGRSRDQGGTARPRPPPGPDLLRPSGRRGRGVDRRPHARTRTDRVLGRWRGADRGGDELPLGSRDRPCAPRGRTATPGGSHLLPPLPRLE